MGDYLKNSEKIHELEFLLSNTGEEAISILSWAKNAVNEWVHYRFCSGRDEP